MNKTIFKYQLQNKVGVQSVYLPTGAEILSVLIQNNEIMMYAKVSPDAVKQKRNFYISETGSPIEYTGRMDYDFTYKFIGTLVLDNGSSVGHLFEQL